MFFVVVGILSPVVIIVVTTIGLGMEFHWDLLVRRSVISIGFIVFLFMNSTLFRVIRFVTRNERRAIHELLNETSRSIDDLPSGEVAGG